MGENSKIEWTDHTFNPWWGCTRVSPGCEHCYAETFAKRTGHNVWGVDADRRFFGVKHWTEPVKWNTAAEKAGARRRVFCASMADVFETPPNIQVGDRMREERQRLGMLIASTPSLDWLLLTKRPQNVLEIFPAWWFRAHPNVWIGTTVEDQRRADERIPLLQQIPASVRFLSCEPLLGPLDLSKHLHDYSPTRAAGYEYMPLRDSERIHWLIAGGESGAGFRKADAAWVRSVRDQAVAAGVSFFFKQWGGFVAKAGGRELDGREWSEVPQSVDAVDPDAGASTE